MTITQPPAASTWPEPRDASRVAMHAVHHHLAAQIVNAICPVERSIWARLRNELLTGFGIDLNDEPRQRQETETP